MSEINGLSAKQRIAKRCFDIVLSIAGLAVFGVVICIAFVAATLDTRANGFFFQERVGKHGRIFKVIKIRTMKELSGIDTVVTCADDPRITRLGRFWRKTKIDELPQLLNIIIGDMSFVGPRPDVPGFADKLTGKDRSILNVRPGITGPATLKYRNEEEILSKQADPEKFNREIIFPDKVRINREYINNYKFTKDIIYIYRTIFE